MSSDRVEVALVIVAVQASFTLVAGLTSLPFAIVEPGFRILGLLTIIVAALMLWLASRLRRGSRGARRCLIGLEIAALATTVPLSLLPIGELRGPVPLLVNLGLPACVLLLLLVAPKAAVAKAAPASHQAQQ